MQSITYLALLGAIWKLVDAAKNVTAKNVRALLTQALGVGAGIGTAFLVGASDFGKTWDVGAGMLLTDMNGASKAILGIIWGAGVGAAVDIKKSLDNTDSAKQPILGVPSSSTTPTADGLGGANG